MKKTPFYKTYTFWLPTLFLIIAVPAWWFLKDACEGTKGCLSDYLLGVMTFPVSVSVFYVVQVFEIIKVNFSLSLLFMGSVQWLLIGWLLQWEKER